MGAGSNAGPHFYCGKRIDEPSSFPTAFALAGARGPLIKRCRNFWIVSSSQTSLSFLATKSGAKTEIAIPASEQNPSQIAMAVPPA